MQIPNITYSSQSHQRNLAFDLLRILAAIMVVLIHVSGLKFKVVSPNSLEWEFMNLYDSFARSCVPIFFMLTGAFSLRKDIDIRKLYLKKILPLLFAYIIWSFFYVFATLGVDKILQTRVINIFRMMISGKYHLWYIPTLIGIYMLLPILRSIVGYQNGKYIKYYLLIFLIAGVLRPTILAFLPQEQGLYVSLLRKVPIELMSYSGYVLLGYYLANTFTKKTRPIFYLMSFVTVAILSTIICQGYAQSHNKPIGILYFYTSLPTFIEAISLFLFFKNLNIKFRESVSNFVTTLSSLTFGLYLFHPYVLDFFDMHLSLNSLTFIPLFSIPVITVAIVLICIAVTFIAAKIPFIKYIWKF